MSMSYFGVFLHNKTNFEGSVEFCSGSVAAINYNQIEIPLTDAVYHKPVYDSDYPPDSPYWLIFQEKSKALDLLRQCKDARLREFPNIEQALRYVQFGFESVQSMKLCGKIKKQPSGMSAASHNANVAVLLAESTSTDSINDTSGAGGTESSQNNGECSSSISNGIASMSSNSVPITVSGNGIINIPAGVTSLTSAERPPFRAPTKQELVEFRKTIEAGDCVKVNHYIWENPRYLISSGDTPSNLKEGYRYNAMHICAQFNQSRIAELILQVVSNRSFASLYTGKRATPNMCATLNNSLLDYYLNMPDKGRSETPLHFAAKNGHVQVVAVLTSFVQCKSLPNKEGQLPIDIICQRVRNPDPEVQRKIELLLTERFYVPVLRAQDLTLPPQIGQPFSSNNPPDIQKRGAICNPLNPDYKIKALAGPMNKDKAKQFCRRWKTPPRLGASPIASPVSKSPFSTPLKSACVGNSSKMHSVATPVQLRRRMLFSPSPANKCLINGFGSYGAWETKPEEGDVQIKEEEESEIRNAEMDCELADKQNGNHERKSPEQQKQENKGPKQAESVDEGSRNATYEVEDNNNSVPNGGSTLEHYEKFGTITFPVTPAKHDRFRCYRSAEASPFTSDLIMSPGLQSSPGNSSQLDDSTSSACQLNDSFKERHIKNSDFEKGLETIGRQLARQENVDWNEYWDFLEEFVDIALPVGLEKLEKYFAERKNTLETVDRGSKQADYVELCSALSKCGVNNDGQRSMLNNFDGVTPKSQQARILSTSTGTVSTQLAATMTTTIPQVNTPYTCVEKSLQVFAKRMTKTIVNNITNVVSINDTLLSELKRLKSLICSFKEDARFYSVDFSKVHARIGSLVAIYISQSQEVLLASKIKLQGILRSQLVKSGERREHLECVFAHMLQLLEQSSDELPDYLKTEELCSAAWAQEEACDCQWDANLSRKTSRRKRTESFYAQQIEAKDVAEIKDKQQAAPVSEDPVATVSVPLVSAVLAYPPTVQNRQSTVAANDDNDEEEFWSNCGSDADENNENDDSNDEGFQTPPEFSTPNSVIEDQKYKLYIYGDEPTKRDLDVLIVISDIDIEVEKFPNVFAWKEAMLRFSDEEMNHFPSPTLVSKTHKPHINLANSQLNQQLEQEGTQQKGALLLKELKSSEPSVLVNEKSFLSKLSGKSRRLLATPKVKVASGSLRAEAVVNATNAANFGNVGNTVSVNTALPTTPIAKPAPSAPQPIYRTPLNKVRGLFSKYRDTVHQDDLEDSFGADA